MESNTDDNKMISNDEEISDIEQSSEEKEGGTNSNSNEGVASLKRRNTSGGMMSRLLSRRLSSSRSERIIDKSVLNFSNVNFVVGGKNGCGSNKSNERRNILSNINGCVQCGHVLAIMGPSGAGKTTLINVLALEAFFGKPSGVVTINSVPISDKIFKQHCFVVKQQDKHWPYLTAKETLLYASELYNIAPTKAERNQIVCDTISKMGLKTCMDTRCSSLSGGQRRRLSIAVALLKQPTLLFLDEPTSGLDAAAASHIMSEIKRVAKDENLIIICTIHQPSTKVYDGFDQVMILSRGQEAFAGNVNDAEPYFTNLGHPLPPATNPAEHFLDLVNSDFVPEEEVTKLLDTWEDHHQRQIPVAQGPPASLNNSKMPTSSSTFFEIMHEIPIMFRRHFALIVRDPILYLGRCGIFVVANLIFALVYLKARSYTQAQAINKMWLMVWWIGVPANMGVVAVYALNDEFKSVVRESKNGMITPLSYVLAKTIMVIPIMFIFTLCSLGISGWIIHDYPGASFAPVLVLFSVTLYVFENAAEAMSVWFDDPILGMLCFLSFWFAAFLFGGFLIPQRDLFWPFELFYYLMPFQYYMRSSMYSIFSESTWEYCDISYKGVYAVCEQSTDGIDVLEGMSIVYPLISSEKQIAQDIFILIGISLVYKLLYIIGVLIKTRKVASIGQPSSEDELTKNVTDTRVGHSASAGSEEFSDNDSNYKSAHSNIINNKLEDDHNGNDDDDDIVYSV